MSELIRIIYAEDEPDIQQVAIMALEDIGGFTVQPCNSGQEMLDKAKDFAPDLILLDVMMPNIDGPETLLRLREIPELVHTPAAFMTAKVQPNEIEHFLALGAIGVIPKPFDPMTLADQIRGIWNKHVS